MFDELRQCAQEAERRWLAARRNLEAAKAVCREHPENWGNRAAPEYITLLEMEVQLQKAITEGDAANADLRNAETEFAMQRKRGTHAR